MYIDFYYTYLSLNRVKHFVWHDIANFSIAFDIPTSLAFKFLAYSLCQ